MPIENAQRVISFRDTEANVEALTGTLKEIAFAYASDTNQFGFYDPLVNSWRWMSVSGRYRQFAWMEDGLGSWEFATIGGLPTFTLEDLE